ncbi:MAG: ATP-binding cassette domain-containing protein [Bacteroidota bacterium]
MTPPSSPAPPALRLGGVRHAYDGRTALDLDLEIGSGDHHLVLGPSGSGKTTLLHVAAGLLRPDDGRTEVAGQDLYALPEAQRDRFRGQHIGIVFQGFHLVKALTAEQNVSLARSLAGLSPDPDRVSGLLDALDVAHRRKALPDALSQGERQRVAVARALACGPALLLADEPTSALDDARAETVGELLLRLAEAEGATLVVATHDARLLPLFSHRLTLDAS